MHGPSRTIHTIIPGTQGGKPRPAAIIFRRLPHPPRVLSTTTTILGMMF